MGYDTVLKDMKRRNMEARVAARKKQDNDAGTLQDDILRALPIREADAISVISLKKLFSDEPMMRVTTNVFSLFNCGRCRRTKRHDNPRHNSVVHYYYWKESESNKEVEETPVVGLTTRHGVGEDKTLREKVLNELPTFGEYAINVQTIYKRMEGAHTKSSIGGTLAFLHSNNYVEREKRGKYFYYWRKIEGEKEETINKHITTLSLTSQLPIEKLIAKYKEDNKKLDERILNIEKQIADLGRKQELQTEIEKREENEKRLAELEEQLHKIAIADTFVKKGILH